MKTILVPTDFSPEAENAIKFASEFNRKLNSKIFIFHSYLIPIPATDIPIVFPSDTELKKDVTESLQKLKQKISVEFPESAFEVLVSEGFPQVEILNASKKSKCDLIIMGTRGASGLKEVFIGSNTASVMEKSVCPVIAVPENAKMKGMKKIVFAANYGSDDFKNVFELIDIARLFDSEIILLHINTRNRDKALVNSELEGFSKQLVEESKFKNISHKVLEDSDVYHGLNSYLEEINADLLAISMRNRSFAQKVFSRSITKKMAYHTRIPILAFHTNEN